MTNQALFFCVDANVRYWEDAVVNGVEESETNPTIYGSTPPKPGQKYGGSWMIEIDINSGKIKGWPPGTTAQTHYKVCDDVIYSIRNSDGLVLAQWNGVYVPGFLDASRDGSGDYIILDIDGDGVIKNWSHAAFADDDTVKRFLAFSVETDRFRKDVRSVIVDLLEHVADEDCGRLGSGRRGACTLCLAANHLQRALDNYAKANLGVEK